MTPAVRVMHLSVVHKQDEPRIYERECRTLAGAGYDVVYLAPGTTDGRDEHGVRVMPLPVRVRARRWMDSGEVLAALYDLRPHVLHVHDPELLTLFPLLPFVPRLVYDMHDYVPEQVLAKEYIPQRVRPLVSRVSAVAQKTLAACSNGVVTAYEDMLASLGSRPRLRSVAPNYPRLSRFAGAEPIPELAADPRLRLVYVGSLSRSRGCTVMLDVMERLERDDAVLVLGGTFTSKDLEAETLARLRGGLDDRVVFLGRVPPPDLPRYLAAAEVVWMPSLPSVQYVRPNVETKIYEGLAVGLAALVSDMAGRGEFVRRERCGIAVPPDVEGHLDGVRRLLAARSEIAAMGERGRQSVYARYSWESVEQGLIDFYRRLG
jgi:glycosyltransferase involved in cell wall biosynthesis